jgi:hypothetical protein
MNPEVTKTRIGNIEYREFHQYGCYEVRILRYYFVNFEEITT